MVFFHTEIKRCEMDNVASCEFTRSCTYRKGHIASLDYPKPYPQRSSCSWNIVTEAGTSILLSFVEFDIQSLGDCDSSAVMLYNGNSPTGNLPFAIYCNSMRPPSVITSAFNSLFIELTSGAEESGLGFHATYEQRRRSDGSSKPTQGNRLNCHHILSLSYLSIIRFVKHIERTNVISKKLLHRVISDEHCPKLWTAFKGNCYHVSSSNISLNWLEAEEQCLSEDAHLVSIRDSDDMEFIHSIIVDQLESLVVPPIKTYIGKKTGHFVIRFDENV